ncbi:YecA family protein [Desulfovibrio sp. QI0434]
MGKSTKKRKVQKIQRKPDDYFHFGPIELARFGKEVVCKNNMSKEEVEQYQKATAEKHPGVCEKIDSKIQKIVKIVSTLPPLELLKQAHWKYVGTSIGLYGDANDKDAALALRMIDYIQSIVASTKPAEKIQDLAGDAYGELENLVNGLFKDLPYYFSSRSLYEKTIHPDYNLEYDRFYTLAQMHWCMVRGDRYNAHEIEHHSAILSPHDDILQNLFGVNTEQIMKGVASILSSLSSGVQKCTVDLKEFQKKMTAEFEDYIRRVPQSGMDIQNVMQDVVRNNGWEDWQSDVFGRFFEYDLYDLQKITELPIAFLDAFSWEQGEEADFFSGEEMRGWPLKVWPVFKRPFLKVEGRYYCFECHNLFDNFYRQMQRVIFENRPDYKPIWASKQQEISESLPVEFFERILPGATIYKSVVYPLQNKNEWAESDIIICYEDHLFIVEVKAGSFTYTSPATDFPSYIASLKNLVYKPAMQGMRFLQYLKSRPIVSLYDNAHNEVGTLSAADYYQLNVCVLTLDSFTELACQPEQLKGLGIDIGENPIWAFSIDDLRIYADIFSNPLVFLHYAEQRKKAFSTEHMMLNDEMDHLGLYLDRNAYASKPLNLSGANKIFYHGFSSKIDEYYAKKLEDKNTLCPLKQDMPARLEEIINALANKKKLGRRKAASALLDCGGEWRDNIASLIDQVLVKQRERGTIQPIVTLGETKINIVCWDPKLPKMQDNFARDHCYATMLIAAEAERTLFELFFNEQLHVVDIDFEHLRCIDIPPEDIKRLKLLSADIKAQRWSKAKQTGKVGRNQLCPCGSGKKYKNCCAR